MSERSPEPSLVELADRICALDDPAERRAARLAMREDMLRSRLRAKQFLDQSRFADALARFGGGSLLTATLLVLVSGEAGRAIVATAVSTFLLFVGGTLYWRYAGSRSLGIENHADRLDAVLKETER